MIQAILFSKDKYSTQEAKNWLKENEYKAIKPVHKTDKFLRYRINEPDYKKYNYRFLEIKKNHIYFIVGYKK